MKDLITKLQEKPYDTRLRILWVVVITSGILLTVLFVFNIKNTFSGLDGKDLLQLEPANSANQETAQVFASVEHVEQTEKVLKLFFNFHNTTSDILNVPKITDITLRVGSEELAAQKMTDRQGNAFVQKILSNTQNFGILYFPVANQDQVTLILDGMFLEKNPENFFMQKLDLNLQNLSKTPNLRN